MQHLIPRLAGLLTVACLLVQGVAVSAPPTLSHVFPAGGQRGAKVAVTCSGQFAWPVNVFAPGVEVVPGSESGKLEISVPADLAADRVWIRLHNAEGASATFPFLIGNLPEVNEQEPNNSPRMAQALPDANTTVNGVLVSGDVDGFAMNLTAGQTLVAAVDANARLGSPMDAVLQVVTPNGTVLADNHDDYHLDPRLAYTATVTGPHIVRLFAFAATPNSTIAYYGASTCLYRLTLTTGPFVTHSTPLAVSTTEPGVVEVLGWNVPPETKLPVVALGGARMVDQQEFESPEDLRRSPDARVGIAFAPNLAGDARVRLNPHATLPMAVRTDPLAPQVLTTIPTCVTGRLAAPRQTDHYRIPLQKGQLVLISVESRSLGLMVDPVVQLSDPTGAIAAEVDDTGSTRDAVATHTAAQDGEYRLTVTDRYRQGNERSLYLLTVRLEEPDFELSTTADALVVTPDKPAELTVKILRRASAAGQIGQITIEPVGLPEGVTAPAVISEPTGPTAGEVKLSFASGGPAYSGPLRILGKSTQPKEIARAVRTPPKLGATFETIWLTAVAKPAEPAK